MSYARQLLGARPGGPDIGVDAGVLATAIDALGDCALACAADSDADLSEPDLAAMVACVRLCHNCADVCAAAAGVLSRPAAWDGRVVGALLDACVAACRSCGDECERHAAMHEHCRTCSEACRRCEHACREVLDVMK